MIEASRLAAETDASRRLAVDRLLEGVSGDVVAWAGAVGPVFTNHPEQPELAAELTAALLRTDPDLAAQLARVTFLSDVRTNPPAVQCPTLVIQVSDDPFVPTEVGEYVRDQVPRSSVTTLETTGHFPHMSDPQQTARAITDFLGFLGPIGSFLERTRG